MNGPTAKLNTVSWGDPAAPNTALLVYGLTGRADVTDELLSPVHERVNRSYPSREAYVEYVKNLSIIADRWNEHLERYFADDVRPVGDAWRYHADPDTVGDDREKMHSFSLSEMWPRVRCPALVLLSTVGLTNPHEGFILPPSEARRMQETIPICTLVDNTNYYDILYSALEATTQAIKAFLAAP